MRYENIFPIGSQENCNKMCQFVSLLTNEMHKALPGSLVIWYDSVIFPEGLLKWQNELNNSNKVRKLN